MLRQPQAAGSVNHWLALFCLVFAGEMIFGLPFNVARFFRPTLLEAFGLSNTDLGDIFAVYGVTAMLAYFPGGMIADRFSSRRLMAASLVATALGGLYFAQLPGRHGLMMLFAWWGVTSILLFWAALIKATREWGGHLKQGRAFGILDGGRGLLAAAVASIAVVLLGSELATDSALINHEQRVTAIQRVIYFYTFVTLLAALLVWWVIPDSDSGSGSSSEPGAAQDRDTTLAHIKGVLGTRIIWYQAGIVICAYCGYKGADNYGLYVLQVLGSSEVESAQFTSMAAYVRPVAAVAAGFLAERFSASRVILTGFVILVPGYLLLASLSADLAGPGLLSANLLLTLVAVFAIRAVYFALLEETKVDKSVTGTAVGLVSVVGFTPDIFFAPIGGRLLDASPGITGHQHYFMLLAAFAVVGLVITLLLARGNRRQVVRQD